MKAVYKNISALGLVSLLAMTMGTPYVHAQQMQMQMQMTPATSSAMQQNGTDTIEQLNSKITDVVPDLSKVQMCDSRNPASWRNAQTLEGVDMDADPSCDPDMPELIAAVTKGTNNVSTKTLNATGLAPDAVVKGEDKDHDGDPDVITIHLEIWGMNEGVNPLSKYEIAPGITPAFWAFAPKGTGMVTEGMTGAYLLRMPSPTIRVEQGDEVHLVVSNTHYLPHTLHLHGVDHPFVDANGEGNDGDPMAEIPIMPGETRTYDFTPRTPGTMVYHCHVDTAVHVPMGLAGMIIVEPNRPNNWLETLNIGDGMVRHRSVSSKEQYAGEYDLQYQDVDKQLSDALQQTDDVREIAKYTNQVYNATQRIPEYFLLNGKSFPYTLRESQIFVDPNKKYLLRVYNAGISEVDLHAHGHKFLVKALDGIDLSPGAQYYRDVVPIATSQRVDLVLNTTNDGVNSYGPGVWMMHDHDERHVTTNGIEPGGDMDMITYKSFLMPDGFPKMDGMEMRQTFLPEYYKGLIPAFAYTKMAAYFQKAESAAKTAWWKARSFQQIAYMLVAGLVVGFGLTHLIVSQRKRMNLSLFSKKKKSAESTDTTQKGFAQVQSLQIFAFVFAVVSLLLVASFAHAAMIENTQNIHIMPDGTVMLGTGATIPTAKITADGLIQLDNGDTLKPVLDMRSDATKAAYVASLKTKTTPAPAPESTSSSDNSMGGMNMGGGSDMSGMGSMSETKSTTTSHLGMPGMDAIHIMPNGHVMLGTGEWLSDATIRDDGMIVLGDGELIKPKIDMRNGDGMRVTDHSMVMNENLDRLPVGCDSISDKQTITVQAGTQFAQKFSQLGLMYAFDQQVFHAKPCEQLTVRFINKDHVRHQFMIHNLPQDTYPMGMFDIEVTGPAEETGTLITPPYDQTLFVHCGVPDHEEMGMAAEIIVGKGDGDKPGIPGLTRGVATAKNLLQMSPLVWWGLLGAVAGAGLFAVVGIVLKKR